MSANYLPCRVPATMTKIGVHWVIVPVDDAEVALINETGRTIVEQCDGTRTVEDLVHAVAGAGVEHDIALADVTEFLNRLYSSGLLKRVLGPTPLDHVG
ncbi:hypothetical protein C1701_12735 [Actinoalloteichus sp. AHMU CJ021]|uniref:PqqD family protein n=1 Tax=Actinoalloteichus sp. AHMU CJ021 TaxID=2072503 RepID=UPI000CA0157C|nr:hypothetical protein C1701_12735 [Actinoalloteichus sp. AHMU CJ021]